MHYIVLDLEWNCVMIPKRSRKGVIEHPSEIIEIGAVKLDEKKKIVDSFSILVKPFFIKKVQKYILSVTHLTDGQLAEGVAFPEAIDSFFKWCGDDYILCTWGCSDLPELRRNIAYYYLDYEVPEEFIDLQIKYALCHEGCKAQRSVKTAVETLKIKEDLEYHRAINDAIYTARIFQKIDLKKADRAESRLAKNPNRPIKKKAIKKLFKKKDSKKANPPKKVVVNKNPMNQRNKPKKVIVVTNEVDIKEVSLR